MTLRFTHLYLVNDHAMNYMYALRKIIFRWGCLSERVTQLHHRPQSKVSSIVTRAFSQILRVFQGRLMLML